MATYTSTRAGNWSASATWGGSGPPGAGDLAIVAVVQSAISATANNGSGLVRLTVGSTSNWTTGQYACVSGVTGTTEANGLWVVTVVDATHLDLQGSAFANTYVSGGNANCVVATDTDTTVGATTSVGIGVTVNGTSASQFGALIVLSGVTLTLRGFDLTTHCMMQINRYGLFAPQAGSTIVGDVPGDYSSCVICNGILTATGSSGSHITFTSPAGAATWSNSASAEASAGGSWDNNLSVAIGSFTNPWIANAANTGIGSLGDSSLTFGGTNAAAFTHEVASVALVLVSGDFYVDYRSGWVWYNWNPVSGAASYTKTYKYGTLTKGWGIQGGGNTTFNELTFNYCDFSLMGRAGSGVSLSHALYIANKQSDAASGSTTRKFALTNCTVNTCTRFCRIDSCTGTALDPIPITGNTITNCPPSSGLYTGIFHATAASNYVHFANNTISGMPNLQVLFFNNSGATMVDWTGWTVTGNTCKYITHFMIFTAANQARMAGADISGNTFSGVNNGAVGQGRILENISGKVGAPCLIHDNVFDHSFRHMHPGSYLEIYNNLFYKAYHHGIPACTNDLLQITNVHIYNNLFFGEDTTLAYNFSSFIELGYNHNLWLNDYQIYNNTFVGNPNGAVAWGDLQDVAGFITVTNAVVANNLSRMNTSGTSKVFKRLTDTSAACCRVHTLLWDYNLDYNYAGTPPYTGLATQGMFVQGGVNYNTIAAGSRNVPGAALFDPTTPSLTGTALAFVYTSATSQTLTWGSGTPVQLTIDSGTATSGATSTVSSLPVGWLLNDTGKTWATDPTNAASPKSHWCKITGGTGSGQIGVITSNTATQLKVAMPVGATLTIPDVTSTYTILKAEAALVNGGETVHCGVDWTVLWPSGSTPSSGTDSSISFASHRVNADPLLTTPNGTTAASYKVTAGSPALDVGLATYAPALDYFGTARPQGSAMDIGFFELLAATAAIAGYTTSHTTIGVGIY